MIWAPILYSEVMMQTKCPASYTGEQMEVVDLLSMHRTPLG